jgi:hypothetical protein
VLVSVVLLAAVLVYADVAEVAVVAATAAYDSLQIRGEPRP